MDINQAFPSKYLAADDLFGSSMVLTMTTITVDTMRDGTTKPVLFFQEQQKGLVLNKTNAKNISGICGPQTEAWNGRQIELYPTTTDFGGETVDCIRVRQPQIAAAQAPATQHPGSAAQAPLTPQQAVQSVAQGQHNSENPNPTGLSNPNPLDPLDA